MQNDKRLYTIILEQLPVGDRFSAFYIILYTRTSDFLRFRNVF
jgi:hypothetical protein